MDAAEFRTTLRGAWAFLDKLRLVRTVSSINSLAINIEFNEIALALESSYRDIYLAAVSLSYYNIMLEDFSIYQFSWRNESEWRLAYLPNPWIAGVDSAKDKVSEWEALEELGTYDQEDVSSLIGELPYFSSIPAIRFEYSTSQYRELSHPCAHLHIGRHTENRWPLARALNPLTFVMLLTKMYYVDYWAPYSAYYGGPDNGCFDQEFIDQLNRTRLVHDFSEMERRSFHSTSR